MAGLLGEGGMGGLSPWMTQIGLGLLSQPTWQQGIATGVQGGMAEAQKRQKRDALMKLLGGGGLMPAAGGVGGGSPAGTPGINPNAAGPSTAPAAPSVGLLGGGGGIPNAGLYAGLLNAGFDSDIIASGLLAQAAKGPAKREMYKGADGYQYWVDSPSERVNPNIQAAPERSSAQNDYLMAKQEGYRGTFMDYQQDLARSRAAKTSVILPPQETAYDKALGGDLAKSFVTTQQGVQGAMAKAAKLERMAEVLPQIYTGTGAEINLAVKRALSSVGLGSKDGIGEAEQFQAFANELALDARSTADGGGMPGAMSDKDREFLTNMNANLGNSLQGNALKIEAARRVAQRQIEYAAEMRKYAQQHGGRIDAGWYSHAANIFGNKPLFEDIRNVQVGGASAPSAAPQAGPGAVLRFRRDGSQY